MLLSAWGCRWGEVEGEYRNDDDGRVEGCSIADVDSVGRMGRLHEALTSALSEKDAHLALLEVGGVRSSRAAQEVETLKKDRAKLLDAINHQSEERVRLSQYFNAMDLKLEELKLDSTPPETPPPQQ
ncbi:hypothetical protein SK128_025135, partial [Halocaridina rubra]